MSFQFNEHACEVIRDYHAKRVEDTEACIESLEKILGGPLDSKDVAAHVSELDRLRQECQASKNKIKEMDDYLKSLKQNP